jgi:hypothetical protein
MDYIVYNSKGVIMAICATPGMAQALQRVFEYGYTPVPRGSQVVGGQWTIDMSF